MRTRWQILARLCDLAAVALLGTLLQGSSCQVYYCSEDCDPCFQTCKCSSTCTQHLQGGAAEAYVLEDYVLDVVGRPDGVVVRSFHTIQGLALDRAFGVHAHTREELVEFARGVQAFNEDLLGAGRGRRWLLEDVQGWDLGWVVTWKKQRLLAAGGATDVDGEALVYFFDPRGVLLGIELHDRG